jgi:hypothetical protein
MHANTGAVAATCCVKQIGIKGSKKVWGRWVHGWGMADLLNSRSDVSG